MPLLKQPSHYWHKYITIETSTSLLTQACHYWYNYVPTDTSISLLKQTCHYWNMHIITKTCHYWKKHGTTCTKRIQIQIWTADESFLIFPESLLAIRFVFTLGVCIRIPQNKTSIFNNIFRFQQNSHLNYNSKSKQKDLKLDQNILTREKVDSSSFSQSFCGKQPNNSGVISDIWYLSAIHGHYMQNLATLLAV